VSERKKEELTSLFIQHGDSFDANILGLQKWIYLQIWERISIQQCKIIKSQ